MDTHQAPYWKQKVLRGIGAPLATQNLRFFEAQARAEGGTAKWNPLNTTVWVDGFTLSSYNSIGVKNYSAPLVGIGATIITFASRNGDGTLRYGGILGDLQSAKKTAEQIVTDNRDEVALWGTNPDLMLEVLKEIP